MLVYCLAGQAMLPPTVSGGEIFSVFSRTKPPTERDHSVEALAKEIDYLQCQIDTYGTVVPKTPDVWGQARLTKHRQEYEAVMLTQLYNFQPTLQASLRRSDESFLGLALSLNASASSGGAAAAAPAAPNPPGVAIISQLFPNGLGGAGASSSGSGGSSASAAPAANPALAMIDNAPYTNGSAINRNVPLTGNLKDFAPNSISLEPTTMLDQMSRYLEHLKELRRINEGDDTADSPGYSMNLVRMPISVTPGKKTRKGYGAEITVIAKPYLSEELLPMTMRNLVINDIVDQLGLGLLKCLESTDAAKKLAEANSNVDAMSDTELRKNLKDYLKTGLNLTAQPAKTDKKNQHTLDLIRSLDKFARDFLDNSGRLADQTGKLVDLTDANVIKLTPGQRAQAAANLEWVIDQLPRPRLLSYSFPFSYEGPSSDVLNIWLTQSNQNYASARARRGNLAFPPSQAGDVYGPTQLFANLMRAAQPRFGNAPIPNQLSLLDVESWLRQEVEAAYDFLSVPNNQMLWSHCTETLVQRILGRARRNSFTGEIAPTFVEEDSILALRDLFFVDSERVAPRSAFTATETLAWAIIVESALLTNRLIEDMDQVAKVKGCGCLPMGKAWLDFYGPQPTPEAREAFAQYVMCRWPVHVFALDPQTDDQNEADTFSRRRELQIALAVGVANGTVSANAAMRFMRRLELDLETISLNRTAIGFAHGDDTFGWRFFPRVQTPPTARNGRAFLQTLTGAPTEDQDLRQRQLEPAMRECEAIVIMPSFVPYVTFDSRANWFCLTHPRNLELTLHQSMKISRTYQGVREEMRYVCNSNAYRAGDVERLKRVVDQLDREMPLQTMKVQVPFENSLGGFEMFSTGISDLGPEFKGYYGAPGVRIVSACPAAATTTGSAATTTPSTPPACCSPLPLSTTAPSSTPPTAIVTSAGSAALAAAPPGPTWINYTCPGVDMSGNQCAGTCGGTTMFLVGRHFSVHDTKVIAGGKCVPFVLLSREIMRVTIPCDVDTVVDSKSKAEFVDVHVATPYGVTAHMPIPAIRPNAAPKSTAPTITWDTTDVKAQICYWPLGSNPAQKDFTVKDFAYLDAPKTIKATDTSPQTLHPNEATLQFRVLAQAGSATPVALGTTPSLPVKFKSDKDQGTVEIKFQGAGAAGEMIKKVITDKLTYGQQATSIVVEAYVNFDLPVNTGMPNIKFDKPITIALSPVDCSKPMVEVLDDSSTLTPLPDPSEPPAPAAAPGPSDASSSRRRGQTPNLTVAQPVLRGPNR
jgi:hypothetical protein